jgi:DNA-binding NtrC family response regulator
MAPSDRWVGEGRHSVTPASVSAIEPREQEPAPNEVIIRPGMTMDEIMRAAIEVALREARGNRRKAAKMLGMGERTLYRKLKDYNLPGL